MDSIRITGGKRLEGKIPISGAKNSALTLLPCALLTADKLTLGNLPRLADVDSFGHLLNELGVSTKVSGARKGEFAKRRMTLQADEIASTVAPYDMVRKMRASILVLGPMLARMGEFDGLAARRLRDRRPADRPSPEGARGAGRRNRTCCRLCEGQRAEGKTDGGRLQLPGGLGRRHRKCADGGGAR